jgi:hypothetical protein
MSLFIIQNHPGFHFLCSRRSTVKQYQKQVELETALLLRFVPFLEGSLETLTQRHCVTLHMSVILNLHTC